MKFLWLPTFMPSSAAASNMVRITGMGASISDIALAYKGLWIQVVVYFLTAWLFYTRQIRALNRSTRLPCAPMWLDDEIYMGRPSEPYRAAGKPICCVPS